MTGITQVISIIKHDQKSIEWWVSVWHQEPLTIIHLGSVCLYYKAMDSNGPCRVTDVTTDHNSFLWNEPQYRLTPGAGKLGQVPCCLNLCGCLLYKSSFVIFFKTRLPSVPRNDKGLVAIINLYGWSLLRPGQVALKAATCTYSRRIQDGKSENHSEHNTCRHITILRATQIRFQLSWNDEAMNLNLRFAIHLEMQQMDSYDGFHRCQDFFGTCSYLFCVLKSMCWWFKLFEQHAGSTTCVLLETWQHHNSMITSDSCRPYIIYSKYSKTLKMWPASVYESKMNST